jgi:hypothetical protein
MPGLSELFVIVLVISFLGSILAGTVFLIWVRGKSPQAAGDGSRPTKFRVPDWQYAVVCGTGVLFVIGVSFPIDTYLGKEEAFYWTVFLTTGLLLTSIGFLGSWLLRRSSTPVAYSRWAGPVAVALITGAFCAPCLVFPAGVRGSKERVRRERAEQFASTHPIAKLLIAGTREADFNAQMPSAQFQESESDVSVGLRRYRNENSAYDFLDERLMSVGWREITDSAAHRDLLEEICGGLGTPDQVAVPKHLVEEGAKQLLRWNSADADLEIEIATFDSPEGKAEFNAAFTRRSEAKTLQTRKAQAANR